MTAKISSETVRADFNDPLAVVHYARAAHFLGLWASERKVLLEHFPATDAPLLEAGCGAGRVTLGLWDLGYRNIVAFDFAEDLVEQARHLVQERGATGISVHHADATSLDTHADLRGLRPAGGFGGVVFAFNGLMQIPGRERRRTALRQLQAWAAPNAPFFFTTHDRESSAAEKVLWRLEAQRWAEGRQDPRLVEFGDRYFEDECGRTFMHLPDRTEILEDLAATGWAPAFDALRREIARESRAVRDFSDECRLWVARRA